MNLSPIVAWLARILALLGGLVLVAMTVITVVSIIGRALVSLGFGPVPGDYELVEAGAAFAVFCFLPWCQLNRGHATVDIFTSFMPAGVNRFIDLLTELLMTFVIVLIAWRLWDGTVDKINYHETTFILQFPVWWAYAACVAAAAVGIVVSVYMLVMRAREVMLGRSLFGPAQGGMH